MARRNLDRSATYDGTRIDDRQGERNRIVDPVLMRVSRPHGCPSAPKTVLASRGQLNGSHCPSKAVTSGSVRRTQLRVGLHSSNTAVICRRPDPWPGPAGRFPRPAISAIDTITCSQTATHPAAGQAGHGSSSDGCAQGGPFLCRMSWRLPDTHHSAGVRRGRHSQVL